MLKQHKSAGFLRVRCASDRFLDIFSNKVLFSLLIFFRSEYGAFWKCVTAGFIYMFTQLAKMLFLATFFPVAVDEDEDYDLNAELPFDFLTVCISLITQINTNSIISLNFRNFSSLLWIWQTWLVFIS